MSEKKELWDAYDSDFKKIEGLTLVRGEEDKIPKGAFHLVCEVLVRHVDGTYLLMKRDPNKNWGGMWESTAGGSALQGEDEIAGALRELREETGLVADKLEPLERAFGKTCWHSRFLFVTDCDKNSIKLQEGETVDYKWVKAEDILSMSDTEFLSEPMRRFIK